MKKIVSILLLILPAIVFAQTTDRKEVAPYRLGGNIGVVWENNNDVPWNNGKGWGLTFHKILNPYEDAPIHLLFGGRYLKGESFGADWQADSGLANNLTFNGSYAPELDYDSSIGYLFQNHHTELKEWSLEAMLSFNQLKMDYNIDFYVFGGLGLCSYYAWTNQLDGSQSQYDYTSITSTTRRSVLKDLDDLRDNSYETPSFSSDGHEIVFTPSLGVGLGYFLTPNISIGIEHKVSFPRTDLFDGQQWDQYSQLEGNDDIYHYTSIGFSLYFGKKRKTVSPRPSPTPTPSRTLKPEIIINQPSRDPYYSSNCEADIIASIKNIESKKNIRVYRNGSPLPDASYDYFETSKKLYIKEQLEADAKYRIFAYNNSGNASKEIEIKCTPVADRPSVVITRPTENYTTFSDCQAYVVATTTNVSNKNQIEIRENGQLLSIADYNFSSLNQEITINRKISGTVQYVIKVSNDVANASDRITVKCGPQGTPPEITIINKNSQNVSNGKCKVYIEASITNMESKNGISVRENGQKISSAFYSYSPVTKKFILNKEYSGQVNISVTAQNEYGYDIEENSFSCKTYKETELQPQVMITSPTSNPHKTKDYIADITATITNIESKSQIQVSENGNRVSSSFYKYDARYQRFTLQKAIESKSTFVITATNNAGRGSDQITIEGYREVKMPEVVLLAPTTSPYTAKDCKGTIIATINNIQSKSEISLTNNGSPVNPAYYNYQPGNQRFTYDYVIDGKANFLIKASNSAGVATKAVIINCIKSTPTPTPTPKSKPSIQITKPTSNPYTSSDCKAAITALLKHVELKSDIKVYENGNILSSSYYTYHSASGVLTINRNMSKSSIYKITVSTEGGSDTKSISINCQKKDTPPPPSQEKPQISISYPTTNPFKSVDCKAKITAHIKYINSKAQISVYENGSKLSESYFEFNPDNMTLSINRKISKNTTYKITASNGGGSSSISQSINCVVQEKPIVKITNPSSSPKVVTNCVIKLTAKIENIISKSQIKVYENSKELSQSSYSWSVGTKTLSLSKKIGSTSIFKVVASNKAGSASAQAEFRCIEPILAPTVKITSPTSNPYTTANCDVRIVATTTHIKSASQITITDNGKKLSQSEFSFNANSQTINLTRNVLNESTIIIQVANENNSSKAQIRIKCEKPILKPIVNIKTPAGNPVSLKTDQLNVTAKILNIQNKSQITVLLNGQNVTPSAYTFTPYTKELKLRLSIDRNSTLIIKATNKAGTASDSRSITYDVVKKPPIVTIISPTSNPYNSTNCIADITAKIENVSGLDQITVIENGKTMEHYFYTWDASKQQLRIQQDVRTVSSFTIKATNKDGSDSKSISIKCARP
jgi:copper chaperone CopZ